MPADNSLAARRLRSLTLLYELRVQSATVCDALSVTGDLRAALAMHNAHGEVLAAIDHMEKAHPELL